MISLHLSNNIKIFKFLLIVLCFFCVSLKAKRAECFSLTEKIDQFKKASQEYIAGLESKRLGVKDLTEWREAYEKATKAVMEADLAGADRYASDIHVEALNHLELAKKYALKRSYKKAYYLAQKAEKEAGEGTKKANEYIKTQRDKILPYMQEVELMMQKTTEEEKQTRRWHELILDYQNVIHHVKLEQFDLAFAGLASLKKRIEGVN